MDPEIIQKYASHLERASWFLILFGMLTQVSSSVSFPSYNIAIGFWGVYCAFAKHGRAVFAFIAFCFISILLDIIFASINSEDSSTFQFALTMLALCEVTKAFCLYASSHLFASLGGAYSMETSLAGNGHFNSLDHDICDLDAASSDGAIGGQYYPPDVEQHSGSGVMEASGTF